MRGRILFWAASASTLLALFAEVAAAQSQGQVLTRRGHGWADETEAQSSYDAQIDAYEEDYTPPMSRVSASRTKSAQTDGQDETLTEWDAAGDESCVDGNCDLQSGNCGGNCRPWGLAAGVEATYLRPSFDDSNTGLGPSNYDREAGARIWLQYQAASGWGIRTRYWDFNTEQTLSGVSTSDDTIGAVNNSEHLDVYAVDLELTRAFAWNKTNGWWSVGARTGRLQRQISQQLTIFDLAGGGGDDATLIQQEVDRGMTGTGITMGLDLRRPIGESRLSAVCNLRGSVLWGTNELDINARVIEVVPVGVGDLDLNDDGEINFDGSNLPGMWIGELQVGAEWLTPLNESLGGGNAFVRVVYEAQWWNLPGVTTGGGPSEDMQNYLFQGVTAAVGFTR